MIIQKAYKTALKPTKEQERKLNHYSDVVRFCYNLFLGWSNDAYEETGKRPFVSVLIKRFRAERREKWPWTLGACSRCEETAGRMLDGAYAKFFEYVKAGKLAAMQKGKRPRKDGKPHGFPRFKSRHRGPVPCTFWSLTTADVKDNAVRLQGLGWIRLHEDGYLPTEGVKINSATVSYRAGHWFISLQVDEDIEVGTATGEAVGVDVGITSLATTSDGRHFENPKALRSSLRKLARLNRKLARQEKGSGRRADTKERLSRLHYRIGNIRQDATQKASSDILGVGRSAGERPSTVVIEDLNVNGMLKNRRLAMSVADANMSELHRQLEYKGGWYGSEVVKAHPFYASTKTCSACGCVQEMKLSERVFRCQACGDVMDRDENAAVNLKQLCSA